MKSRRVSIELEVPFHDVDSLRIVWHGHYIKYLEIARTALMRSVNLDNDQIVALKCGLLMGEVRVKHTGVLRYGDKFRVTAWFRDIENRINISYEVRNLSTGRRAARARTTLVLLDENSELCLETPDRVKERLLTAFE